MGSFRFLASYKHLLKHDGDHKLQTHYVRAQNPFSYLPAPCTQLFWDVLSSVTVPENLERIELTVNPMHHASYRHCTCDLT